MKRGRKSAAELAAQAARQPADLREPWQIAQAARCGCRGADDLCGCQNENAPWRYGLGGDPPPTPLQMAERRIRELEGHVRTLELQQQTDRQTIANMVSAKDADAGSGVETEAGAQLRPRDDLLALINQRVEGFMHRTVNPGLDDISALGEAAARITADAEALAAKDREIERLKELAHNRLMLLSEQTGRAEDTEAQVASLTSQLEALKEALRSAHTAALSTKGYPTVQSEAVKDFCENALRSAYDATKTEGLGEAAADDNREGEAS